MPEILTPRLQYGATAARPGWRQLPQAVRGLVERRLGGAVRAEESAGGGFTSGYAAVVRGAGRSLFVKAVEVRSNAVVADCYRREAVINEALPPAVPAPRIRWTDECEGWLVLAFDAVEGGRMPAAPWRTDELDAALAAYAVTAEALAVPSGGLEHVGLRPVGDGGDFDTWRTLASGRTAAPGPAPSLFGWVPSGTLDALAELESGWRQAVAGTAVLHHDLRQDNVLLDAHGSAWICDWNWACLGASWFDLVLLLASAYADGHDATALFRAHPTARGVDDGRLDAALAALSGFFLASGDHPPADWSPYIRQHQTWCGEVTLRWLAERRGWQL
ncbi:aminoglycoside phosphotransferase [Streptomyces venezuelae]|uniref:Aminoglycoside phosphotransferase n=1 Tax=Streptomyces venezuelae TaxID=54571 RepID=A0A5P2DSN4_STRVZ|nr:phosphotransferase [Streptomyces venezuelae]QES57148.1 aminoglycoside phosphotransferase [Streptomyces venezuelae]